MPPKIDRFSYKTAAVLWLVFVAIFFHPVLFQGQVLAPLDILDSLLRPWAADGPFQVHNASTYDAISQYLPYDWSVAQSLTKDGYIGWNPYTHSGSAITENTMICPGDWHHQLYRILSFWTAWNAGIILQFAIAGLGMLVFLRHQKIPAAFALLAAIAFGFYSQHTLWIYHRWVLGAMCWAPWIVWALSRARESGRVIDIPSIGFIGLAFRGGHLQTCIFVVLLVLGLAVADLWRSPRPWTLRPLFQRLLPYTICGIFGTILALDVVIQTVPALLHGKREMESQTWLQTLATLPTLVTSIFPTIQGTPQGLDLTKWFGGDLFEIKFMGGVVFLLATLACCQPHAPLAAKLLFIAGLVVPFTPLNQWLYSRFTVVSALGGGWLAAWYLQRMASESPSRLWNRALIGLALVAGVWLLASIALSLNESWVLTKLHAAVRSNLPEGKASREAWMISRADAFLGQSLFWFPRNLINLALLATGLFACSRIHNRNQRIGRHALLLVACTFGEMLLFASTWVTFSDKPTGNGLYSEPTWATNLRNTTRQGTIRCLDRSDVDYMQLNTPSSYGIRFAEGYETVTPRRIDPLAGGSMAPAVCAAFGISHLLVAPDKDPGSIPGWTRVIASDDLVLYGNPNFDTWCHAHLSTGGSVPLVPEITTPNVRTIHLPPDVSSLTLMESFNPGWMFSLNGRTWKPVSPSDHDGIQVTLDAPTTSPDTALTLRFVPPLRNTCLAIMVATALALVAFSLFRRFKSSSHLPTTTALATPG